MNIKSLAIFSSLTLSVACSVTPNEGDWVATGEFSVESNTCDSMDIDSPLEPTAGEDMFTIALTDGGFTIDDNVSCTLSGSSFDCDMPSEFQYEASYADMGFDAVGSITQVFSGSFSSSSAGDLIWTITATCTGPDCAAVQAEFDFPDCEGSWKLGIEHSDAAKD